MSSRKAEIKLFKCIGLTRHGIELEPISTTRRTLQTI